jgi:hypothetical protein
MGQVDALGLLAPAESEENLTTLAPDIVAAILDETLPPHVTVHDLAISPPVLWEEQRCPRQCVDNRYTPRYAAYIYRICQGAFHA